MAGVSGAVAQAMRYAGCPNRRSLGLVFFCALSEQMSSGGNIIQRPPALRAVHQD